MADPPVPARLFLSGPARVEGRGGMRPLVLSLLRQYSRVGRFRVKVAWRVSKSAIGRPGDHG